MPFRRPHECVLFDLCVLYNLHVCAEVQILIHLSCPSAGLTNIYACYERADSHTRRLPFRRPHECFTFVYDRADSHTRRMPFRRPHECLYFVFERADSHTRRLPFRRPHECLFGVRQILIPTRAIPQASRMFMFVICV